MTATHEATAHGGHEHAGNRLYFVTWLWLLVITVLEVGVVLLHVPRSVLVSILILLTLMKAFLIVANFMHLRFERFNLVYVILVPAIFAVIMWYWIALDY
ncbi:MAG TPA: cytochrome C oxidase subunit IV family protein [Thermaerobacter sp.]